MCFTSVPYRDGLHRILGLGMTRPHFRHGNAVKFYNDSQTSDILINPHEAISQNDGTYFVFQHVRVT